MSAAATVVPFSATRDETDAERARRLVTNRSGIDHDGNAWPEPLSLVAKIPPEPYPVDALPAAIRAAVEEVQSFTRAPFPLVASSAIASLSVAAQAHVDVTRSDKLTGPSGMFLLTIADSGERKSTCDGFFARPIRDYEARQAEVAAPKVQRNRADVAAWEAKRAGVLDTIRKNARGGKDTAQHEGELRELERTKPTAPRVPRLVYGDATPEALTWNLAKVWPSAGVLSSEAGAILGAHGMGRDSIMRNLATLNELWDGKPLYFDRRTSESFTVRGARLTVALQIQEATLRSFFDRSGGLARGCGFLARFLIAWPESTMGHRPFVESPPNWPALATFHQCITAILELPAAFDDAGTLMPKALALNADAKEAWIAFHDAIEIDLRSGGELHDVRDVASKTADNAARLAVLFHVFGSKDSNSSGSNIGVADFKSAARIAAWHLHEARRFFGELALPAELGNAARLDTWLLGYCRDKGVMTVSTKTVQQFGPSGIREKAVVEAAVRELEDLGRAKLIQNGRRKDIRINPALLDWETKK